MRGGCICWQCGDLNFERTGNCALILPKTTQANDRQMPLYSVVEVKTINLSIQWLSMSHQYGLIIPCNVSNTETMLGVEESVLLRNRSILLWVVINWATYCEWTKVKFLDVNGLLEITLMTRKWKLEWYESWPSFSFSSVTFVMAGWLLRVRLWWLKILLVICMNTQSNSINIK